MNKLYTMLERLAEYFPKQNYQDKLEKYLNSKNIKSTSDVEHWTREFIRDNKGI